jgi:hypothetical protein
MLILFLLTGRDHEGSPTESDDEGFPGGLHGQVPQYDPYRTNESRDCSIDPVYTEYCYFVTTEADDARSLALIVEDIIRADSIEESQDKMVLVHFDTPEGEYTAYAFRHAVLAKGYWTEREMASATVIDSVYVFYDDALYRYGESPPPRSVPAGGL